MNAAKWVALPLYVALSGAWLIILAVNLSWLVWDLKVSGTYHSGGVCQIELHRYIADISSDPTTPQDYWVEASSQGKPCNVQTRLNVRPGLQGWLKPVLLGAQVLAALVLGGALVYLVWMRLMRQARPLGCLDWGITMLVFVGGIVFLALMGPVVSHPDPNLFTPLPGCQCMVQIEAVATGVLPFPAALLALGLGLDVAALSLILAPTFYVGAKSRRSAS